MSIVHVNPKKANIIQCNDKNGRVYTAFLSTHYSVFYESINFLKYKCSVLKY